MQIDFYMAGDSGFEKIGTFRLEGTRVTVSSRDEMMEEILQEPVYDPKTQETYYSEDSPKEWLEALTRKYRGGYMQAVKSE